MFHYKIHKCLSIYKFMSISIIFVRLFISFRSVMYRIYGFCLILRFNSPIIHLYVLVPMISLNLTRKLSNSRDLKNHQINGKVQGHFKTFKAKLRLEELGFFGRRYNIELENLVVKNQIVFFTYIIEEVRFF